MCVSFYKFMHVCMSLSLCMHVYLCVSVYVPECVYVFPYRSLWYIGVCM